MPINTDIQAVDDIFQEGKVVDGFVLGKEVHRGGMASLFSATKEGINVPILLKIPRVGRDQPVESLIGFETELTILRSLKSPYVPQYLGSGNMATRPYIAMERVGGRPLEDYIKEGKVFTIDEVVRIGADLAQAVQSLHSQDAIHLDVKPENILIDEKGKLTLIDFGLSHHARYPDLLAEEMRKGIGSAPYISPEQVAGIRSDSRSDIFSIGVIMYELLTGELPFGNPQTMSGLRKRMWAEPFPPRAIRREIPRWLQEVVLRCLEPRAADRYQSAARLRQVLRDPEGVTLTERADRVEPPSFWENLKGMFKAAGYEPSPSPRPDPASRIVEFAKDNDASLILIGASHKLPNKVTPWRTSMTKIVEEAPCSVHIVRT